MLKRIKHCGCFDILTIYRYDKSSMSIVMSVEYLVIIIVKLIVKSMQL